MRTLAADIDLGRLAAMDAPQLLRYAFETFGDRVALGTSLQKTGIVMIDLVHKLGLPYRVFFVDTLLNHDQTYQLLHDVQQHYGITIERFSPDPEDIESLYRSVGQYAHFFARTTCCHVRKTIPLRKALATLDVWIAGLRADQSEHRDEQSSKAIWTTDDDGRRILKLNPLLDWTADDVQRYTQDHGLPYNKLYDYVSPYGERFSVIGCQACHIPVRRELGPRAGKFPWEQGKKECGMHADGSGI